MTFVVTVAGCTSGDDTTDTTTSSTVPAAPSTVPATSSTTSTTQPATASTTSTTTTLPEPPHLEVLDPVHGATVTSARYTFSGVTDPGCTVTVGGRYEATVAEDGTWSLDLMLEPGRNSTTFTATHPVTGLETSVAIRVTYEPPTGLRDQLVFVHYDRPWRTHLYYADWTPSHYFLERDQWFDRDADGFGDLVLAFAAYGWWPEERYIEHGFDGAVLLLEPQEDTSKLVLDEQPISIAEGAGVLTTACPVGEVDTWLQPPGSTMPHIVILGFTGTGSKPIQAWRIDLNTPRFEQVDTESLFCPDFAAYLLGSDGVGAIETQLGWVPPTEWDDQAFDISMGTLQPMAYYGASGMALDPEEAYPDHRVAVVSGTPYLPDEPRLQRAWLKEILARDWTGQGLSRILAATPWTASASHSLEWIFTGDGGLCTHQGVVAEVTDEDHPIPTRAWAVGSDLASFIEVDPNAVTCQRLDGGPLIECRCQG